MLRNIPLLVDFGKYRVQLKPFVIDIEPADFIRIPFGKPRYMPFILVQKTVPVARQPIRHQRMPHHRVPLRVQIVLFAEFHHLVRRRTAVYVWTAFFLTELSAFRFIGVPVKRDYRLIEKFGELFDIHLVFPAFLARELIQHERIGAETEFMPFEFVTDRAAFNRSSVRRNKLKSQRFFARRLGRTLNSRINFRRIRQQFAQGFLSLFSKCAHFNFSRCQL